MLGYWIIVRSSTKLNYNELNIKAIRSLVFTLFRLSVVKYGRMERNTYVPGSKTPIISI